MSIQVGKSVVYLGLSAKQAPSLQMRPWNLVSPKEVSGLLGWWDFSDATTLYTDAGTTLVSADAQAIQQINDKSGNSRHALQTTAAAKPTYKVNIVNGKSVARFDGGDLMEIASLSAVLKPVSIFCVARSTAGADDTVIGPRGGDGLQFRFLSGAADIVHAATADIASSVATVGNTPSIIHVTYGAAGAYVIGINGVDNAGTSDKAITSQAYDIGASLTGENLTGDIAELVVYDTALSTANQNSVGNYLAAKYGLSWTTI